MGINGTGFPIGGAPIKPSSTAGHQAQPGQKSELAQQPPTVQTPKPGTHRQEETNLNQLFQLGMESQLARSGLEGRIRIALDDSAQLDAADLIHKLASVFMDEFNGRLPSKEFCAVVLSEMKQMNFPGSSTQKDLMVEGLRSMIAKELVRERMQMQRPLQ